MTYAGVPSTGLVLLGKPGCHLCDDARAAVAAALDGRPVELREVDVSLDPTLNRDYGERIPVIAVDGVERFQFYVTRAALAAALGA